MFQPVRVSFRRSGSLRRPASLLMAFVLMLTGCVPAAGPGGHTAAPVTPAAPLAASRLVTMPLSFIENQGQVNPRVGYYVQGRDASAYFTPEGLTYAIAEPRPAPPARDDLDARAAFDPFKSGPRGPYRQWAVTVDLVDRSPTAHLEGVERTDTAISYFTGAEREWKTGLPAWRGVQYQNAWTGIDVTYGDASGRLKYDFLVWPGADPTQIALMYRGQTSANLDAAGRLVIETPYGAFADEAPVAWQDTPAGRMDVPVRYSLRQGADGASTEVRFQVAEYDPSLPLTIDPYVTLYLGYLGGGSDENSVGRGKIAVDTQGAAYVAGTTRSADFPAGPGFDTSLAGNQDAFVAKVNSDGSSLAYATFIGGLGDDLSQGVAVDIAGSAYVTGSTPSSEDFAPLSFPLKDGPRLTNHGGGEAFVTKLTPAGTALAYSGFIGGFSGDGATGIAVDSDGSAYVVGTTASPDFPIEGGTGQPWVGSQIGNFAQQYYTAFLSKIRPDGTGFTYSTFLGPGTGVAVDVDGQKAAYVTGIAAPGFPFVVGPSLRSTTNANNSYVLKLQPDGSSLVWSGPIAGNGRDFAEGIAVDDSGNAYVIGQTTSSSASFPAKVGPDFNRTNLFTDGFIAKVKADGSDFAYFGFLGQQSSASPYDVKVNSAHEAYVAGAFTGSVVKIRADGTGFVSRGLPDTANGVPAPTGLALDSSGAVYLTGSVNSQAFTPVVGPGQTHRGGSDAYVGKFGDATPCLVRPQVQVSTNQTAPGTLSVTLTATSNATAPGNQIQSVSFTSLTNATVEVAGQGQQASPFNWTPNTGSQAAFTVRRSSAGPFTVRLNVNDACGAWPTFVGGGPNVQ